MPTIGSIFASTFGSNVRTDAAAFNDVDGRAQQAGSTSTLLPVSASSASCRRT
jgi:hypothetical protein